MNDQNICIFIYLFIFNPKMLLLVFRFWELRFSFNLFFSEYDSLYFKIRSKTKLIFHVGL